MDAASASQSAEGAELAAQQQLIAQIRALPIGATVQKAPLARFKQEHLAVMARKQQLEQQYQAKQLVQQQQRAASERPAAS